ncbi:hypothetical protein PPACK8108_LOCUS2178 [Phakopsora pachyrhizi]|uniref:Uncharacterized protein n=1 Tax=Phakopsora pachyrhizi TaxID=170000 RepID=A0AAV0AHA9_PHAPC|nr:hypothetical protein PPACK8108_LOCUS2178 [Phakopsora pachyrhizi]
MSNAEKDDDQTGIKRSKENLIPCPTSEDVNNLLPLPENSGEPLSSESMLLIPPNETEIRFPEDADVSQAFIEYSKRRACQYAIRYVSLALPNSQKNIDWNQRIRSFLLDCFNRAMEAQEFSHIFHNHLDYQLAKINRFKKNPNYLEKSRQKDCKTQRREVCSSFQELRQFEDMFIDETLCSSDNSDQDDILDEDRSRRAPGWRSQLATEFPAKRFPPEPALTGDAKAWPIGLPIDCYDQQWLATVNPKICKELCISKKPRLSSFFELLRANER